MRIIIAGGRNFSDYDILSSYCDKIISELKGEDEITIVSGHARGADLIGELYATQRGYPKVLFPAKWEQYGKSAGYIRNKQMAEYSHALIAFWDGESRGTANMIKLAKERNLLVNVYRF